MTQMLGTLNGWMLPLDANENVNVICLDFSKAFERFPHHLLFLRLEHLGFIQGFCSD